MAEQRQLPGYAYLPPELACRQTNNSSLNKLLSYEVRWRDRYRFLETRGYRLRNRYNPSWKPSWVGTNLNPEFCEDFVVLNNTDVIDATRLSDGSRVAIKTVKRESQEAAISQFLSSLTHPTNHCVPVYDVFEDPTNSSISFMVMQYLHPWNDPEFSTLGDVVDFVGQMLENFSTTSGSRIVKECRDPCRHSSDASLSDIASLNIMMDGSALYPGGHHPVWRDRTPDAVEVITPLQRVDHRVKYFYVDFGLSVRFPPEAPTLVVGDVGRDAEVPELSSTVPYDSLKADIYALGNLFHKELEQRYHNLHFLRTLIDAMKRRQSELRPTASELVIMFASTKRTLDPSGFRWRLSSKSEPAYERLFNDTVAVAKESLGHLRRYVQS